jgi:hypothetical protein
MLYTASFASQCSIGIDNSMPVLYIITRIVISELLLHYLVLFADAAAMFSKPPARAPSFLYTQYGSKQQPHTSMHETQLSSFCTKVIARNLHAQPRAHSKLQLLHICLRLLFVLLMHVV